MPNADPATQRLLLDLADLDRSMDAARTRRATLPELEVIARSTARAEELEGQLVIARTEIADLDRAARKLDDEIDSVRAREKRDQDLLASGAAPAKELENLQHELDSLARRQAALEDDSLELMEQREEADAAVQAAQSELDAAISERDAALAARDEAFSEIDVDVADMEQRRLGLVGQIPPDVLGVYERLRTAGKVAAAELRGDRCGACQISLDRASVEQIRAAPEDSLERCPECSAILVRHTR